MEIAQAFLDVPGVPAAVVSRLVAGPRGGSPVRTTALAVRTTPVGHLGVAAFVPVLGLASCVPLLRQQEGRVWSSGLGLLLVGVLLHAPARMTRRR